MRVPAHPVTVNELFHAPERDIRIIANPCINQEYGKKYHDTKKKKAVNKYGILVEIKVIFDVRKIHESKNTKTVLGVSNIFFLFPFL